MRDETKKKLVAQLRAMKDCISRIADMENEDEELQDYMEDGPGGMEDSLGHIEVELDEMLAGLDPPILHIKGGTVIKDQVSGLKIKITGSSDEDDLGCIHIEFQGEPEVSNRDFFFSHRGDFDGTGSAVGEVEDDEEKPVAAGPEAAGRKMPHPLPRAERFVGTMDDIEVDG